jgi:hypothetical protein
MIIRTLVNFDRPDGSLGTLHTGDHDTLATAEAALRSAADEARAQGGTALVFRMVDNETGVCVYKARVPE